MVMTIRPITIKTIVLSKVISYFLAIPIDSVKECNICHSKGLVLYVNLNLFIIDIIKSTPPDMANLATTY